MKQLSGLDASFLHLETPEMPMHVGGLHLFDLPPGYQGDFYDNVKAHVASRMHLAPIFTKKLACIPAELANPVWVDDDEIDLDYHIQRVALPKPGTMQQLEAYVGRIHAELLDRSRPLWQFFIFEGLATGQAALLTKLHHAALDGLGALALAQAVLDLGPVPRTVPTAEKRRKHAAEPSARALLGTAIRNALGQYWKIVKAVPDAAKAIGSLALPAKDEEGKYRIKMASGFKAAPRTLLNQSITNQRVFAAFRVPIAEAKAVGKAFGGSLNDAVMAICSGALRRYLEEKEALPENPLKAAVPVNLREPGDNDASNEVSMLLVSLATDQADPEKRLREIIQASKSMKSTLGSVKSVLPTDFPSLGIPWLMSVVASLYGRLKLADKIPPIANLVISNVPGAPMPLYLAGARMASNYPLSIPTHGLALNITVQSYNGALDFGLVACRRAMPDLRLFVAFMNEAHRELLALVPPNTALDAKPETAAMNAKARALRKKRRTPSVAGTENPVKKRSAEVTALRSGGGKKSGAKPPANKRKSVHQVA